MPYLLNPSERLSRSCLFGRFITTIQLSLSGRESVPPSALLASMSVCLLGWYVWTFCLQNLPTLQAGASSLIDASLRNNDLQTAKSLLAEAQSGRQKLSTNTVNSLLNSLAKTAEIAEIVQIVIKLTQQGFVPDKYTYTALLAACNYADAGELAFTVWRYAFCTSSFAGII